MNPEDYQPYTIDDTELERLLANNEWKQEIENDDKADTQNTYE